MKRVILTALVATFPAIAIAADPEDVVEARKGYFELLALEFGPLAAMAKGEVAYDAGVAKAHAADLVTLSKYDPTDLYAPGTAAGEVRGSEAKPEIWTNNEAFKAKGMALYEAIAALEPAAGAGQKELGAAVQKVGAACKGCHDDFREKD